MKKLLALLGVAVLILITTYSTKEIHERLEFPASAEAEIFVGTRANAHLSAEDVVQNGDMLIVRCYEYQLKDTLKNLKDVKGISLRFRASQQEFDEMIKKYSVSVVSNYQIEGINIVNGKLSRLARSVVIGGKTVNIQFAYSNGLMTVGTPLILGSY